MIDPEFPFKGKHIHIKRSNEISTGDPDEYNIFDTVIGAAIGVAKKLPDGTWRGCVVHGPHDIPINGDTVEELAGQAHYWLTNELLKE